MWWGSASDWTAPSVCRRLCASRSYSQWAGCVCLDRSPGSQFSTMDTKGESVPHIKVCKYILHSARVYFQENKLHLKEFLFELSVRKGGTKENSDWRVKHWSHYLFQTAVHSVRTADVKTQQNCIRVTVAQGPHIIVVRRTLEGRKERLVNVNKRQDKL